MKYVFPVISLLMFVGIHLALLAIDAAKDPVLPALALGLSGAVGGLIATMLGQPKPEGTTPLKWRVARRMRDGLPRVGIVGILGWAYLISYVAFGLVAVASLVGPIKLKNAAHFSDLAMTFFGIALASISQLGGWFNDGDSPDPAREIA